VLPTAKVDPKLLKSAVRNGELELAYQPEVELGTNRIVALEALVRWTCPGVGRIAAHDFLPVALLHGLLVAIDTWMLESCAVQAAVWHEDYGQDRLLWMNLSLDSLLDEALIYRIAGALDRHGLPATELGFEISEQSLLGLGEEIDDVLEELHRLGLSLVIDDFRSVDAALDRIASLPIHGIKLPPELLHDSRQDERIANVVAQAQEKGMYVVAEGVETPEQESRVIELGFDRAHGYLYGSAQRADRAAWLLEQGPNWRGQVLSPIPLSDTGGSPADDVAGSPADDVAGSPAND
jgi:EAL domain-containing protein (putative c-di-GMP-specific phosphodiesterase class I)